MDSGSAEPTYTGGRVLGQMVDALADATTSSVAVLPTGLEGLDGVLAGGLRPGELALIGGAPGVGTSTFALGLVRAAAIDLQFPTLFWSTDDQQQIFNRVLSAEMKIPLTHIREGSIRSDQLYRLRAGRDRVATALLDIDGRIGTLDRLDDVLQHVNVGGPRLVVLDLTSTSRRLSANDCLCLRQLSRDLSCSLVVAANADPGLAAPVVNDFRHNIAGVDLFDVVVGLHRPDMQDTSTRPGEVDLRMLRSRWGPQPTIAAAFQGHYARFVNMVRD